MARGKGGREGWRICRLDRLDEGMEWKDYKTLDCLTDLPVD